MSSWWRRFVNSDGNFEHEPVPVDEYEDDGRTVRRYNHQPEDRTPGWLRWILNHGGNNNYPADYRPPVEHDPDLVIRENEEDDQVELAIQRSLEEKAMQEEIEANEYQLKRALEESKREAEMKEQMEKSKSTAIVPAAPPPLIDLLGDPEPSKKDVSQTILDDEQLARRLQQQIDLLDNQLPAIHTPPPAILPAGESGPSNHSTPGGTPGFAPTLSSPHLPPPVFALPAPTSNFGSVLCGGCGKYIASGRFLNCMGHCWHADCFKCKACGQPIKDTEFKANEGEAYHKECHRELFHPKCSVCTHFIPSQADGVIEFRSIPFWNDSYCPAHDSDGTPRCAGCKRLERRDAAYVELADGRKICLDCVESAVIDTSECLPLFLAVTDFFRDLGLPVTQDIPLLCVETQALNSARQGESTQGHHIGETQGICLCEEQTVQTVYRLPGVPSAGVRIGQRVQKLQRRCEVTAILVLYGLPRAQTESVLAHELMHAYLKLQGRFPRLAPQVEEGLCQVMSHLWLQDQLLRMEEAGDRGRDPVRQYQRKLTEYCLHEIATDQSELYGEGFRAAHAAVVLFGLRQTLDHVELTGNLPEA